MKILSALSALLAAVSATKAYHTAGELEIRTKISRYAFAIDNKNFDILSTIFTDDVTAVLGIPGTGTANGLPAVQQALKNALGNLVTQHAMTTTEVIFSTDTLARSTNYVTATILGQGNLAGQALNFYGTYTDIWVLTGGSWKSKNRTLILSVSDIGSRKNR